MATSRHTNGPAPGDGEERPSTLGALVTSTVIAVLFAGFLVPLPQYNPDARTLPLVVGVPATALALVNVARQFLKWRMARRDHLAAGRPTTGLLAAARRLSTARTDDATSLVAALAWVTSAVAAVLVLGFVWGSFVFMPAFMLLYGRERPLVVLVYTAGVLGVVYAVFIAALNVPYFPGVFGA